MDFYDSRYYNMNRFYLSVIGQWPYQRWKTRLLRTCIVAVICISGVLVIISKFFTADADMTIIAECVQTLMVALTFIANLYIHVFNDENLKTMLEHMKFDWSLLRDEGEKEIVEKFAKEGRLYTLLISVSYAMGAVTYLTAAGIPTILAFTRINVTRKLPFPAEYFVDEDKYFYLILFHMYLVISIGLFITLASFTMHVIYVHHACGLYSLVGFLLNAAFVNKSDKKDNVYEEVVRGIIFHKRAICFTYLLKSSYTSSYAAQLLCIIILLSVNIFRMFHTFVTDGCTEEFVKCVLNAYGGFVCISLNCVTGQKLLDHSQSIYEKAYTTQWFVTPVETQKLLIMVMISSKKPLTISVTKTIFASFQLLAMVTQTSVSYFMVLYSLQ